MDTPDSQDRAQILDLPSLLATTAARQAITPTARVQAQLMAQERQHSRSHLEEKTPQKTTLGDKNSQNFNYLTSKILNERWP